MTFQSSQEDKTCQTIELCLFPPVPFAYNISPFGIKVESYLRILQVEYSVCYTSKFSRKGQIPYMRVDGQEICDSNVMLDYLGQTHDPSFLSPTQSAISHAMIRMLEEHTAQIGFYYRYGLHMDHFCNTLDIANRLFHADTSRKGSLIAGAWRRLQPKATLKKTKARGLTRHSDDELWKFSCDDLHALSNLLGDQPYFFGDRPSALDCTVFGNLAQFLFIPMDFPQKKYLETECPNLVKFCLRFRDTYWRDWEEKCQRQANERLLQTRANNLSGVWRAVSMLTVVVAAVTAWYYRASQQTHAQ